MASESQLKSKYEVPVQQEERLVELAGGIHQGTRGAGRLRLGDDLDRELAEALAVVAPLDLARLVAAQQGKACEAEPPRLMHQVVQERPSADLQQGLGRAVRQRPQPRSSPADQANRLCDRHGGIV